MRPRLPAPLTFQPQASMGSRVVSPINGVLAHARSASSSQKARGPPRPPRWATHKPWRLHGKPVTSTLRETRREKRSKPSMSKRRAKRRKPPSHHNSCLSLRVHARNAYGAVFYTTVYTLRDTSATAPKMSGNARQKRQGFILGQGQGPASVSG